MVVQRTYFRHFAIYIVTVLAFDPSAANSLRAQGFGGFKLPKSPGNIGSMVKNPACLAGAAGGFEIGKKLADSEAARLKLPPAQAAAQRRKFEIGMALALCGGGQAIAGTTYAKLSKRGKENRDKELQSALMDEMPRTYKDPDNPQLDGKLLPEASTTDGNEECKVVEDSLADGSQNDSALVKYCRVVPDGAWKVKNV